jgi:transcriptional regulator with XRE-family HTH domain
MTEEELRLALGASIRAHREAIPVSQEAFADSIKMHRAYYSSIERGEKNPTIQTLKRVTEGLGILIEDLLKDTGI